MMEDLDDLLRREANIEPLHGFEERILHRIVSQRRRRSWWGWAVGAAAACAASLAIWTMRPPKPLEQKPVVAIVQSPAAGTPVSLPTKPLPSPSVLSRHARKDRPAAEAVIATPVEEKLPKLDVFPSSVEDTEQHSYAAALSDPRVAEAAADLKQRQEEPIEIAEIHIAPLPEEPR
ncbi:MAG: hypothetical protein HOQ35_05435 [Acidobacteriaceae bacterium]|nr:hypothetical protein [Acidobacteriaceae bacterium]